MPKSVAIFRKLRFRSGMFRTLIGQPKRTQTVHPHPQGTYKQDSIPKHRRISAYRRARSSPSSDCFKLVGCSQPYEYEAGWGTIGASIVLQGPPRPPPRYSKVVCIRERDSMGRHARPTWFPPFEKYVKIDLQKRSCYGI